MAIGLEDVQQALTTAAAAWTSGTNPVAEESEADTQARLGVSLTDAQLTAMREQAETDISQLLAFYSPSPATGTDPSTTAFGASADSTATTASPAGVSTAVDWRNHNNLNAVTVVRDQGACGSCVAFGSVATLESMLWIDHRVFLDLSEAELFWCNADHPTCQSGWNPDGAVNYICTYGVAQESCQPYDLANQACTVTGDRNAEAIQAAQSVRLFDLAKRKEYIDKVGPMIACFNVYEDFQYYASGVYSQVAGVYKGGHCVEVIGYDDTNSYWIAKNSWNTTWGESGFFRIAYGQCGFDSTYPFWGVSRTKFYT